nr:carboxypeptidase M32 [Candidatus Pantoea persica]
MLLARLISRSGYMNKIVFVKDEPEAIETRGDRAEAVIAAEQPDLVMLDIMLPGKDGKELDRATGGCSLGLAIVHSVAQALGGHATIESRPLGGASVRFCWPVDLPLRDAS